MTVGEGALFALGRKRGGEPGLVSSPDRGEEEEGIGTRLALALRTELCLRPSGLGGD